MIFSNRCPHKIDNTTIHCWRSKWHRLILNAQLIFNWILVFFMVFWLFINSRTLRNASSYRLIWLIVGEKVLNLSLNNLKFLLNNILYFDVWREREKERRRERQRKCFPFGPILLTGHFGATFEFAIQKSRKIGKV